MKTPSHPSQGFAQCHTGLVVIDCCMHRLRRWVPRLSWSSSAGATSCSLSLSRGKHQVPFPNEAKRNAVFAAEFCLSSLRSNFVFAAIFRLQGHMASLLPNFVLVGRSSSSLSKSPSRQNFVPAQHLLNDEEFRLRAHVELHFLENTVVFNFGISASGGGQMGM